MFNVQSAKQQIEKNRIETEILKAKVEFFEKMTTETESGNYGFTDRMANYVIDYSQPLSYKDMSKDEIATVTDFIAKIESLERQLYAIA